MSTEQDKAGDATSTSLAESDVAAIRQIYQALVAAGQTDEYRSLGRFFRGCCMDAPEYACG